MVVYGIIKVIICYGVFFMRTIIVAIVGVVSFIYLINPTSGLVELIPDFIPIVGNLDEAGAMALLVATLGYFGLDISNLFKRKDSEKKEEEKVNSIKDMEHGKDNK